MTRSKKPTHADNQEDATRTPPDFEPAHEGADSPDAGGRGAPIEHDRGEPGPHRRTGDPGDLEEETLDPGAPFNKSYGR